MSSFGMIKEGWLTKEGGKHKTWKKRWFILQENLLYYFESQKDMMSKGTILLSKVSKIQVVDKKVHKKNNCFEIHCVDRVYPIAAESEAAAQEWVDAVLIIQSLHAVRDTYKLRTYHMSDSYRHVIVTLGKNILKGISTITGITKGFGVKHKWAKGEVDIKQVQEDNIAFGNSSIKLMNDILEGEREPYKLPQRKALESNATLLCELANKIAKYGAGTPNESALNSIVKNFTEEIAKLLETIQPTPKKEMLHLVKFMSHQVNRYAEAGTLELRTITAKDLEIIGNEFPIVAKAIFHHIPDITYADPLVNKAQSIPIVTNDVRQLIKNAAFFSLATTYASNACKTLFFNLNEVREITMGAFEKEPTDELYPQVGPQDSQFRVLTEEEIKQMQEDYYNEHPEERPKEKEDIPPPPKEELIVVGTDGNLITSTPQVATTTDGATAQPQPVAEPAKPVNVLDAFDSLLTQQTGTPSQGTPTANNGGGDVMDELDALLNFQMNK